MNEERPSSERHGERDSQLSAMFDGELSAAECELLARRLARDEALRGQWTRYALIGAALRAERGVALHDRVAWRVQSAVAQEPSYGDSAAADAAASRPAALAQSSAASAPDRWVRFARPVFGAGIAAGVAAMSILWLRAQPEEQALIAATETPAPSTQIVLTPEPASSNAMLAPTPARQSAGNSGDYTTPLPGSTTSIAPPARLANYVVAHSEYSGPLSRRLALSGLVAGEAAMDPGIADEPAQPAVKIKEKKVASDAP
jgi:sigma-E factor negative regulatory protein RseA